MYCGLQACNKSILKILIPATLHLDYSTFREQEQWLTWHLTTLFRETTIGEEEVVERDEGGGGEGGGEDG